MVRPLYICIFFISCKLKYSGKKPCTTILEHVDNSDERLIRNELQVPKKCKEAKLNGVTWLFTEACIYSDCTNCETEQITLKTTKQLQKPVDLFLSEIIFDRLTLKGIWRLLTQRCSFKNPDGFMMCIRLMANSWRCTWRRYEKGSNEGNFNYLSAPHFLTL